MKIIVVAPHPDDETLGCGGTLLRHLREGQEVHWLIVTSAPWVKGRERQISTAQELYGLHGVHDLGLPSAKLDVVPIAEIVDLMGRVFKAVSPEVVYLPHPGDVHSDHSVVFQAGMACTKWFRYPTVRTVFAYETLSETDATIDPLGLGFRPNFFVNIESELNEKINIMRQAYACETAEFPFPRSEDAIRALAQVRGAACGFMAAEGFMLLRDRRQ